MFNILDVDKIMYVVIVERKDGIVIFQNAFYDKTDAQNVAEFLMNTNDNLDKIHIFATECIATTYVPQTPAVTCWKK